MKKIRPSNPKPRKTPVWKRVPKLRKIKPEKRGS